MADVDARSPRRISSVVPTWRLVAKLTVVLQLVILLVRLTLGARGGQHLTFLVFLSLPLVIGCTFVSSLAMNAMNSQDGDGVIDPDHLVPRSNQAANAKFDSQWMNYVDHMPRMLGLFYLGVVGVAATMVWHPWGVLFSTFPVACTVLGYSSLVMARAYGNYLDQTEIKS